MKEFDFIRTLWSLPVPFGIGDDAALFSNYLVSCDLTVEGVHFLKNDPLDEIVHNLFVANMSDISAMGGKSSEYYVLLGVSIPSYVDKKELSTVINKYCKKYNAKLIGGDTTTSRGGLFISMTIIGHKNDHILQRKGAVKGDAVMLSKVTGKTRYRLEQKLEGLTDYYVDEPDTALGELLGTLGYINSCTDVSDGLGVDISHIAELSGVKIVLKDVPLPDIDAGNKDEYALSSGEEYCLVFTLPEEKIEDLQKAAKKLNKQLYRIGTVYEGMGVFLDKKGILTDISDFGYEHI